MATAFPLLSSIDSPADLRRLPVERLPEVCAELRAFIIDSLAQNPGHFASSLGAVELTVALHYVLDTPRDRLVWDVGHQAYGHKILTGRRDRFQTNRHFGGLHPFPTPAESEYDTFTCGHASNSISAALGMAVAEKHTSGKPRHVVAVIGDGAMSGGLAFEGLNNASAMPNDLLIVLNDNDMSIDRAVGGMEKYLLSLDTSPCYNRVRYRIARGLSRMGLLPEGRRKGLIRLGNAMKAALTRRQNVFEGMNIRYFGPCDGHDVELLVRVLRQIKDMRGPKLLHLRTVKGKGYKPAEQHATEWHAPGKFDPDTGERMDDGEGKPAKYQDVFGDTLVELARAYHNIIGVTPAMPTGCSMNRLMRVMPDRAFDVGIAEGHAVTFSAGMAAGGLLPFCNIYSAFAQRAYDNIIHDVAIGGLHVVLCLDRAGLVGEDGATHHGAFDIAALRPVPGLTLCAPMDEHELRRMMYTAVKPDQGPWVIRYPRGRGVKKKWWCELETVPVGKARRLTDTQPSPEAVAVLTLGPIGNEVADIAASLDRPNILHYDMRFAKPLDADALREAAQCRKIITIEDGVRNGGFGSAVMEWLADNGLHTPVQRVGLPDRFVEHGTVQELRRTIGMDKDALRELIISR